MANRTDNIYEIVTTKRSVPLNSSGSGTITTKGQSVTGVGTSFTTQMPAGSWLVSLTGWETSKVIRVDSDTVAFIQNPFTVELSAATPQIIHNKIAKPKEISIEILSADPSGLLDNKTFKGILTLSKTGNGRSSSADLVDPIIIDGTGTSIKVSTIY
jgi:hypothetical protein